MEDAKLQAIHDHLSQKKQERGSRGGLGKRSASFLNEAPPPAPEGEGHVYFSDDEGETEKKQKRRKERDAQTGPTGNSACSPSPLYAFFVRGGTLAPSVPPEQDAFAVNSKKSRRASQTSAAAEGSPALQPAAAPASSAPEKAQEGSLSSSQKKRSRKEESSPCEAKDEESEKKAQKKKKREARDAKDATDEPVRCVAAAKCDRSEAGKGSEDEKDDSSVSASLLRLAGLPLLRFSLSRAAVPPSLGSFALNAVLSALLQNEDIANGEDPKKTKQRGAEKTRFFLILGGTGLVDRVRVQSSGSDKKLKKSTLLHINGLLPLDSDGGECARLFGAFQQRHDGAEDVEVVSGSFQAASFILPKKGELAVYGFPLP
ncbi:conserved hypothetical protein [Neospora caninum Liverpool]|uniref:Uncharacterized protein n=1 Tax=Neospora caninum (strain Liverpool) TaxID=572307 RepID=F0VFD2_NEOCL|nr:conserved hypothetical protein [Neospora caninum Liverpool]CBZ52426.1 conserved hypothetical protein [Neospora caninum Liverpool]CEL66398.1 TPA: hypothetical protein BN1204_022150 [Neospora caninum Liverpool]|eukprot:XP_003882458.1 conserved hypothetical protein [Neospora caninum Liverpool]